MSHPFAPRLFIFFTVLAAACVLALPGGAAAQQVDPFGNCCVARVNMTDYNTWSVTCGSCSENPGRYSVTQSDPATLVFTGPGGVSAGSPYDAAVAICRCPSQDARRAREKRMRTYDGN